MSEEQPMLYWTSTRSGQWHSTDGTWDVLVQQYGPDVVSRVNLQRGRVRPSFSLDASVGADLWVHDKRSVRLQADAINLTDRLNVINFASLFSGTAIAPPRSVSARLKLTF